MIPRVSEPVAPEPLFLPAPRRPAWFSCVVLLAILPLMPAMFVAMFLLEAPRRLAWLGDGAGIPAVFVASAGVGTCALFAAVFVLLAVAQEKRWRDVTIDADGVSFDAANPGGARFRWDQLEGFRCRADGVVLVVRGQRWTRLLGPVVWCEGAPMLAVVERLEAHGLRRTDG